jgi:hypothetical protein
VAGERALLAGNLEVASFGPVAAFFNGARWRDRLGQPGCATSPLEIPKLRRNEAAMLVNIPAR